MADKTIFFSYSRDDSEFVLNLAKELRASGANVWLDQLDITPGARWDKSIEDALDASGTVLVVLSNTSVESNNVMDEVSYALEEGKIVVPILLEECDVPFRLRRLQFADFTKSHIEGVSSLSSALGLQTTPTPKPGEKEEPEQVDESVNVVDEPFETVDKTKQPKEINEPTEVPAKKSKRKFLLYGLIGVVVIIGALFFGGVFDRKDIPVESRKKVELKKQDELKAIEAVKEPDYKAIEAELNKLATTINFSSTTPKQSEVENQVSRMAAILNKFTKPKVRISCYTILAGRDQNKNVRVSQQQADLIKEMLVKKGVAANRISAKGYGASLPVEGGINRVEIDLGN